MIAPADTPAVSVCMPVYNGQAYLREAVVSILSQSFGDFEFIIVDDGSTDRTPAILRDFAAQDRRVRVISRPNTGIAGALNDAIAAARGEFVARMDADDVAQPRRFEKQIEFLRAHPEVVVLGSRVLLIDPYGTPLYESNHQLTHEEIEKTMLQGIGWAVVHPTAMMRTAAVRSAGGYRAEFVPSEDLDLFLRLAQAGRIANLPEVLLHYRQHRNSANHTRSNEQDRTKRAILTQAYAQRGMSLPADWKPPRRQVMPLEREIDMWGWKALRHGNIAAARRHALSAVRLAPFSATSWRLMFCALRGR